MWKRKQKRHKCGTNITEAHCYVFPEHARSSEIITYEKHTSREWREFVTEVAKLYAWITGNRSHVIRVEKTTRDGTGGGRTGVVPLSP